MMTGKQSFQLSSSTVFMTLFLAICLVAVSISAPAKRQMPNKNTRPLHLDDIGVYFETILEGIIFPSTNLTLELKETNFYLVCSVFGVYSRLMQTLGYLSEDDVRMHNVSVLHFVAERQTKTLCERVRNDCTRDMLESCSAMDCTNMSSIDDNCLNMNLLAGQVQWGEDLHQNRSRADIIPLWLDEIFEDGFPDNVTILETIETTIEYGHLVNCITPRNENQTYHCENMIFL